MRRMVEKSSTIRNFRSGGGPALGTESCSGVYRAGGTKVETGLTTLMVDQFRGRWRLRRGHRLDLDAPSSASRFITMMLMRRFAGLAGRRVR